MFAVRQKRPGAGKENDGSVQQLADGSPHQQPPPWPPYNSPLDRRRNKPSLKAMRRLNSLRKWTPGGSRWDPDGPMAKAMEAGLE